MKIKQLHIYGFGQHSDVKIDLQQNITVFYGLNEAGKTTLQQFILQVFFGFPQKNHVERTYEPKNGGAYGGKIWIEDREYGLYTVERKRDKAAIGDVNVYCEKTGEVGHEELLTKLLRGSTRADIESVFSFNVHQLQHLDKMSEDDLNRTLLSSGTAGVEQFTAIEKQLEKESGNLFKKSGSVPIINKQLKKLQKQEEQLKVLRETIATYEPKRQQLEHLSSNLEQLREEHEQLQRQIKEAKEYVQFSPLVEKLNDMNRTISDNMIEFPSKGIERFEQAEERITEKEVERRQVVEQLERLQKEVNDAVDEEQFQQLQHFNQTDDEWRSWLAEQRQLEQQLDMTKQKFVMKQQLLRIENASFQSMLAMDSSLATEAQLNESFAQLQKLEVEANILDSKLEAIQKDIDAQREGNIYQGRSARKEENTKKLMDYLVIGCMSIIAILLFLLSYTKSALFVIVVLAAFVYWKKQSSTNQSPSNDKQSLKQQYENTKKDLIRVNQERDELLAQFREKLLNSPLRQDFDTSLYPELFRNLRELQALAYEGNEIEEHLENVLTRIRRRHEEGCAILREAVSIERLSHTVAQRLHEWETARNHFSHNMERIAALKEHIQKIEAVIEQGENTIASLFEKAGHVNNKEAFYEHSILFDKQEDVLKEKALIQEQIGNRTFTTVYTKEQVEQLENDYDTVQQNLNRTMKEEAQIRAEIQLLVEDERYITSLQQMEENRAQLKKQVMQWSVMKVAEAAMKDTLMTLQQEVFPQVIERASNYFTFLTDKRYDKLHFIDNKFEVIHANGQSFAISELSQATKEQAYVALRISLAEEKMRTAPFPLLMDDPFVHFDTFRTSKVVQLLEELQSKQQIILFTCHEHIKKYFSEHTIIEVASLQMKGD